MIKVIEGNVLDVPKGIIVHGCNSLGVFGAGVALQIKKRFPRVYDVYRDKYESCVDAGEAGLTLGTITFVDVDPKMDGKITKLIVNAVTQEHCGGDKRYVDYEAVARCFEQVKKLARNLEFVGEKPEIFFPAIGAGLAGGNWKIISTIIDETIGDDFEKTLVIYKP